MKLKALLLFTFINVFTLTYSQITYLPYVASKNNDCTIQKIELTDTETIVTIKVPKTGRFGSVYISSATVIVPSDAPWSISDARKSDLSYPPALPAEYANVHIAAVTRVRNGRNLMRELGWLIRGLGEYYLDQSYTIKDGYGYFDLHFDRLPYGVENIFIRELQKGGWEWVGIQLRNPYPSVTNTNLSESDIKKIIDDNNDGITGIYEGTSDNKYRLACIKQDNIYKLIYLGASEKISHWHVGEIKAILHSTATKGLFKADWHMRDKTTETNTFITFDGSIMKTKIAEQNSDLYIKMYPSDDSNNQATHKPNSWSGTGFALNQGYIVTNYHVVESAKTILAKGIKGEFSTEYKAKVIATDQTNDIAIIQITDTRFTDFGPIPYKIKRQMSEVGESVWAIGYPMTDIMGDEIKFTDGKISSRTGIQGDLSVYQISVPIQPGNSGGPLFDNNGNIVGITSSGLNRETFNSENVNYAIKTGYLYNLIESSLSTSILPQGTALQGQPLTQKIKLAKKFVFMLLCSSDPNFRTDSLMQTDTNTNKSTR